MGGGSWARKMHKVSERQQGASLEQETQRAGQQVQDGARYPESLDDRLDVDELTRGAAATLMSKTEWRWLESTAKYLSPSSCSVSTRPDDPGICNCEIYKKQQLKKKQKQKAVVV